MSDTQRRPDRSRPTARVLPPNTSDEWWWTIGVPEGYYILPPALDLPDHRPDTGLAYWLWTLALGGITVLLFALAVVSAA